MTEFSKNEEIYIEHEVTLRVHDTLFKLLGHKLDNLDKLQRKVDRTGNKLNWIIGLIISGIVIPIILHKYNFI